MMRNIIPIVIAALFGYEAQKRYTTKVGVVNNGADDPSPFVAPNIVPTYQGNADHAQEDAVLTGAAPENQPARELLARTIWGEARGESYTGMLAVGEVIMNRLNTNYRRKTSIQSVILDAYQFSAWLASDPNRNLMLRAAFETSKFIDAWNAAGEVLAGQSVLGANDWRHYYNPSVVSPSWASAAKEKRTIGNHIFLKGVA